MTIKGYGGERLYSDRTKRWRAKCKTKLWEELLIEVFTKYGSEFDVTKVKELAEEFSQNKNYHLNKPGVH